MDRSTPRFIEFPRDVKHWLSEGPPPVDAARPERCIVCGVAGRDDRHGLAIHGHGFRERVQWGPAAPARAADRCNVEVRRYQCQGCRAIMVVGPRGLAPKKRYSGPAIALALALWGLAGEPQAKVFECVSVFDLSICVEVYGWRSLRRWTRDAAAGALWGPLLSTGSTWRQRAARIAAALASFAPDSHVGSLAAHAFEGAKHVARG